LLIQRRDAAAFKNVTSQGDDNQSDTILDGSNLISSHQIYNDFGVAHPSAHLRGTTTEIERQNINIDTEYGESILDYTK
jgi:hypothetical protein